MKYSGILHLAQSLHLKPQVMQVPIMAAATAYFDESLSGAAYVVAGFAATVERWKAFDTDWARLLDAYQIGYLHMHDYAQSLGEFAAWKGDEGKRRKFMQRAIGIISRRCMVSVGIVIDRAAFQNTIARDAMASSFYVNEYAAAAFMSLLVTGKWAEGCAFRDPADYVFDRGNPHRHDFERAYDIALKIPGERDRFGALSFADDRAIPALQAADLIAYETSKLYSDVHGGKKRFRASMKSLLANVRSDVRIASERNLSKLVKLIREIPN